MQQEVDSLVPLITERLAPAANERTRDWWERYLKGAVAFRGVPMAAIRAVVRDAWAAEPIASLPPDAQIELALRLFAEPYSEDKLAGVLALAEQLLDDLRLEDVPRLARPFAARHIDDWSTCDWYCVKVLGPFVEHAQDRRSAAEAIGAWRWAEPLWQRRAAAVAFVNLAPRGDALFPGFTELVLYVCAANVRDPARFSQTGVGWVLRELSRAEPAAVETFVNQHRELMSREACRAATAKLARIPSA